MKVLFVKRPGPALLLVLFLVLWIFYFWEVEFGVSWSSNWPQTFCVAESGLEPLILLLQPLKVLGLEALPHLAVSLAYAYFPHASCALCSLWLLSHMTHAAMTLILWVCFPKLLDIVAKGQETCHLAPLPRADT